MIFKHSIYTWRHYYSYFKKSGAIETVYVWLHLNNVSIIFWTPKSFYVNPAKNHFRLQPIKNVGNDFFPSPFFGNRRMNKKLIGKLAFVMHWTIISFISEWYIHAAAISEFKSSRTLLFKIFEMPTFDQLLSLTAAYRP